MTHDELLAKIDYAIEGNPYDEYISALRAVVELHKPDEFNHCGVCNQYLCETIQSIEKELS